MKNQWLNYFSGYVTVRAQGKQLELFLNACARKKIPVWGVKRSRDGVISFKVLRRDLGLVREARWQHRCKLSILRRHGVPFVWRRLWNNNGLLFGAAGFLVIIFLLSNMVWGIEIEGASAQTENKVWEELDKQGVKVGKFLWNVDDLDTIQRNLTRQVDEITWIGVQLDGTKYKLKVVEKNAPEVEKEAGPQHLVAGKKAVVTKLFVETGKPLIEVNDYVQKGQPLVSGIIGKEGNTQTVSAKGDIYGETWYKTTVEVPLEKTFSMYTGKEDELYTIGLFGAQIPVWGFGEKTFTQQTQEVQTKTFRFLQWELPLSFQKVTKRETTEVLRKYEKKDAMAIAKELAEERLARQLDEDATVKGYNVLQQQVKDGKVVLTLHFQVVENIAVPKPILQSEENKVKDTENDTN